LPNVWNHPRLGGFEQDDIWWRREITLPSRDLFTYVHKSIPGYPSQRLPFEVVFQCDTEGEEPTEEMAALAVAVLENEQRLIPLVLKAIWSDFNGQGPGSGMWWNGDLPYAFRGGDYRSDVYDSLTDGKLPVPACPSDLLKIMYPQDLTIRRDVSPPKLWLAELTFKAGFEVEHGVGVLTNGVEILGIGYSVDVTRFEQ
jgi:hypothetical protein